MLNRISLLFVLCVLPASVSEAQRFYRDLDVSIKGDAQILLIDSLGRRTGNDPLLGKDFFEIPNAVFMTGGVDSEDPDYEGIVSFEIMYDNPFAGSYLLKVIGVRPGEFQLVIALGRSVKLDGQEHDYGKTYQFSETVTRGSITEYTIYYDPDTTKAIFVKPVSAQDSMAK